MKTKTTILLILVLFNYNTTTAQIHEQDSLALVAFYNSTGGPNWNNNSNWLTGPVITWYGVTVEGDRVIELGSAGNFSFNNLTGHLPTEIGDLTELKKLVPGNNPGLSGVIPEEIGNLQNLRLLGIGNCSLMKNLSLRENDLTGPIPPEIGNLDSLKFLYLHDNQLTGSIPPELGSCTNLWDIMLNDNQLNGTIPPELAGLNNLYRLYLQNNQLTGSLPENFCNFFLNYEIGFSLNVGNNNLGDSLPESWGSMDLLIDAFDISGNNFTYIPPVNYNWLGTFFHIEENKLTFEHIEPHYNSYIGGLYYYFYYAPQQFMCEEIDTLLPAGSDYRIYSGTKGEYTNYEWYHNQQLIHQGPGLDTLFLENISYADTGIYTCTADNSLIYFLKLYREPVHIALDTGTQISHNYYQKKYPAIYPNPASEKITVLLPFESEPVNLRIFNLEGKCVLTEQHTQVNNSEITVGIRGLKPGIYLLRIQNKETIIYIKIIKQ